MLLASINCLTGKTADILWDDTTELSVIIGVFFRPNQNSLLPLNQGIYDI